MEEKLRLMEKPRLGILVLVSFLAVSTIQPILVAHASTSYSFNLIGPNTATATGASPFAGDTLRLTGSGTFDTVAATASGGGSFTHILADGAVFARGTWVITGYQSFVLYGGPSPGLQGGVLKVTVTIIGPEATFSGLTLQVSCLINAPSPPPAVPEEGTTLVGLFQESTGGNTLFHLNG